MNEFVTSLAEPSYLTPLALSSAPFSSLENPEFFYKSEQIEQRINLLQHLIRASDKVALLFAAKGVGKSAVLLQLQQAMNEDLLVCRINAEQSLTSELLIQHCLREFGVDENEIRQSSDHLQLLRQRCLGLQNLTIKPLLVVDDIDQLTEECLNTVLSLLAWQEGDNFLLQAVLTASTPMTELNTIHGRIQRIDYLPLITEIELAAYLQHRLAAAGYQGSLPFSEKILKQMFKRSAGNPGIINQLAHQELLGVKSLTSNNRFKVTVFIKWLSIGLLLISLMLLLVFQDKINALFSTEKKQVQLDQLSQVVPESAVATVDITHDSDISQDPQETEYFEYTEPNEPKRQDENKVLLKETSTNSDEQARKELEDLLAELPAPNQDKNVEALENKQSSKIENKKFINEVHTTNKIKPVVDLYKSEKWILQQKKTQFTYQLMGSWDKSKAVDYIKKYNLTGDLAIFKSDRNGKTWYALIYGVYANKELAIKASSSWPTKIKSLPKWLRSFESVQQQIQK